MNTRKQIIRGIITDMLKVALDKQGGYSGNYPSLEQSVESALAKQNLPAEDGRLSYQVYPGLTPDDKLLISEIFWDLFREGIITLGMDSANMNFPWFRLHSEAKL